MLDFQEHTAQDRTKYLVETDSIDRRCFFKASALTALAAILPSCQSGGHFSILGYSSQGNYDTSIKTVYVPLFKNQTFMTTPYREMEMALTRKVINEIERTTPYKVISDPDRADTELIGIITGWGKNILNRTQQNDTREADLVITVQVVWRDLRDNQNGRILSNPPRDPNDMRDLPPFDPNNPPQPEVRESPSPVTIQGKGRVLPELGQSSATAEQSAIQDLAKKIASLMEKPWQLPPKPKKLPNP